MGSDFWLLLEYVWQQQEEVYSECSLKKRSELIAPSFHRACRLKKKAQYEANKVKLWGLNTEYGKPKLLRIWLISYYFADHSVFLWFCYLLSLYLAKF